MNEHADEIEIAVDPRYTCTFSEIKENRPDRQIRARRCDDNRTGATRVSLAQLPNGFRVRHKTRSRRLARSAFNDRRNLIRRRPRDPGNKPGTRLTGNAFRDNARRGPRRVCRVSPGCRGNGIRERRVACTRRHARTLRAPVANNEIATYRRVRRSTWKQSIKTLPKANVKDTPCRFVAFTVAFDCVVIICVQQFARRTTRLFGFRHTDDSVDCTFKQKYRVTGTSMMICSAHKNPISPMRASHKFY